MAPRTSLSATSSTSLSESGAPCRLGFVGCGTIASAIATGLATQNNIAVGQISVSKRSAAKSSALKAKFGDQVQVFDDNQDVVDAADVVFVTVLPQQVDEVLSGLKFDPDRQVLISLVSTSNLPNLATCSGLPTESVFKMICLPSVADHEGICMSTPPTDNAVLLALYNSLGGVVHADDETQLSAMMVTSGLMGSFYGILRNNRDWLVNQGGMEKDKASFLVGRLYHSMMRDAIDRCHEAEAYEELIAEQTPGGLNEQGLRNLESLGAMEVYDKVQDAIHDRILGKSDGSL